MTGAAGASVVEASKLPDVLAARSPRVDYVIVAYRSERHLGSCLDAIAADRPAGVSVIVADAYEAWFSRLTGVRD